MLLVANYTVTNWLTRGALAEFSAAMLLPWVLTAFAHWLTRETHRCRTSITLGLLLGLTVVAHSVLSFYLVLLLGACALLLMAAGRLPPRRLKPLPLLSAGIAFALIAGPYLVAMSIVGNDYAMSRILPRHYLPENQIKPPLSYLWEPEFQWGKVWDHYTVQLDTPVLALLIAGLILLATNRAIGAKRQGDRRDLGETVALWGVVAICLLSLLLQTVLAIPFYRHVPGAAFLQFPWRLLAILTPGLIALTAWLWQRQPTELAAPCIAAGLAAMLWLSGAWTPMPLDANHATFRLAGHRFSIAAEYIPIKAGTMVYEAGNVIRSLEQAGCKLVLQAPATATKAAAVEVLARQYYLNCRQAGVYPLPAFGSPLHHVRISGPAGTEWKRCGATAEAPALCAVELPEPGSYRVLVEFPTLASLLGR